MYAVPVSQELESVRDREGRELTESKTKLVPRRNVCVVEVSVVDVEALGVVVITGNDGGAVVDRLLGDGVRQLAARRGGAVKDIEQAVARFLA